MIQEFTKAGKISGELNLPGDKSISHRAVIFSSMADGVSEITNLSDGDDVKSTIRCFKTIGTEITWNNGLLIVRGRGFKNFLRPDKVLDAGNSGTTARLMCGLLANQNFESTISGDESLSKRPMERVIKPLELMGARFETNSKQTLPIKIIPTQSVKPIKFQMPIASAQVKSAVLIAAVHSDEICTVIDSFNTRDHTERMLNLRIVKTGSHKEISASKEDYPKPQKYYVPSDISTASFFIVLALLSQGSELRLKNISLNSTRTGILDILRKMGADIELENLSESSNEPYGDLIVRSSKLHNIEITEEIIPNIIDEIPILTIAGIFAEGEFTIRNAAELRKKESDRIKSICSNIRILGIKVDEFEDGFSFRGEPRDENQTFESFGDHRIAMAFSILALLLKGGGKVLNFECVSISNPKFFYQLKQIVS